MERREDSPAHPENPPTPGLTPESIQQRVYEYVRDGGLVLQKAEEREPWRGQFEHYYMVVMPHETLAKGLFVEMILVDDDPDLPVVQIVNAHAQR